jgi:hypothetical protein
VESLILSTSADCKIPFPSHLLGLIAWTGTAVVMVIDLNQLDDVHSMTRGNGAIGNGDLSFRLITRPLPSRVTKEEIHTECIRADLPREVTPTPTSSVTL